jgi:hypothetical protein
VVVGRRIKVDQEILFRHKERFGDRKEYARWRRKRKKKKTDRNETGW